MLVYSYQVCVHSFVYILFYAFIFYTNIQKKNISAQQYLYLQLKKDDPHLEKIKHLYHE